jgi:hypothetical protein
VKRLTLIASVAAALALPANAAPLDPERLPSCMAEAEKVEALLVLRRRGATVEQMQGFPPELVKRVFDYNLLGFRGDKMALTRLYWENALTECMGLTDAKGDPR